MSGSKKYSIRLPENLAETVRAHAGPGGFSVYVAEALEQRVAMDRLREIVADYGRTHRARIKWVLSRIDVHDVTADTADTADQAAARTTPAPVTVLSGCGDGSPVGVVGRGEWS